MKVNISQLKESAERFKLPAKRKSSKLSTKDFKSLFGKEISTNLISNNVVDTSENLKARKSIIESLSFEPADFAFERAIGKNDSVYTNFIDLIINAKKKVGRIVVKEGQQQLGYATGFMVSENLMLTNWHVFKTKNRVGSSTVQFNYELNLRGDHQEPITFKLDPETFFFSFKDLDYCLVAVEMRDLSSRHSLSEFGFLSLDPTLGKIGTEKEERLNIIHHPSGDYKQLSIRENEFTKILPTSIWYKSDTAQGSSGSPVFNDQWQVVALHHMGVAEQDEEGNYVDKYGDIIPIENDQIDVNRVHWIANEGIRISVIRNHIKEQFPNSEIIQTFLNESLEVVPDNNQSEIIKEPILEPLEENIETMRDSIQISVPTELLKESGNISINIDLNNSEASSSMNSMAENLLANESYKLERSMDYSECEGYQAAFIGTQFQVDIPRPLGNYSHEIARIHNSNRYVLDYYKFSVIFNAVRKLPFISAINIDGDEDKRKDETERKDKWIRDTRIDLSTQLDKDWYYKSGFDKGHMSRREDANWGENAWEAKRNADLTCVYTNASPQVPELNRSNRNGVWGKLEKTVLEYGAIKEQGRTGRISVFNGPIFKDTDPIYKGVRVPMDYFKIIVWLNDNSKLRATAFTLSQEELVDNIRFEDIGIDKKLQYKEYQISLKELQDLTHLDFTELQKLDTFKGTKSEKKYISNEEMLTKIVKENIK